MNKHITEPTYMIEKLIRDNPAYVCINGRSHYGFYSPDDNGIRGYFEWVKRSVVTFSDFQYCNKHEAKYLCKVMRQVYKQHQKELKRKDKERREQAAKDKRQELIRKLATIASR